MTDKEKIREEVVRMHNLLPIMDGDNISVNYADRICTTLEMYIDSLQEEPVSNDLEEAADNYVGHAPEIDEDLSCSTKRNAFIAGAQWKKEQMIAKVCVFLESTDFCKYYNKEFIESFKKAMEE